jgi:hypothetical protein
MGVALEEWYEEDSAGPRTMCFVDPDVFTRAVGDNHAAIHRSYFWSGGQYVLCQYDDPCNRSKRLALVTGGEWPVFDRPLGAEEGRKFFAEFDRLCFGDLRDAWNAEILRTFGE